MSMLKNEIRRLQNMLCFFYCFKNLSRADELSSGDFNSRNLHEKLVSGF